MELIIDIPEETYNAVMGDEWIDSEYIYNIINSIQNGTPLPEGHGKLIDSDVLCDYFWDNRSKLYTHKDLRIAVDRQPTIIEADKGE